MMYVRKIFATTEPYEIPEFEQIISLDFKFHIFIENDGNWDFIDSDCNWAEGTASNGDWYSEQYNVYIGDKFDIAEAVYDLMTPQLTVTPGQYVVIGKADLVYSISNVYEISKYVERYEEDDSGISTSIDTQSADFNLNFDKSKLYIDYYLV